MVGWLDGWVMMMFSLNLGLLTDVDSFFVCGREIMFSLFLDWDPKTWNELYKMINTVSM